MKTLITITTCNRLEEVKKYIFPYISFCNKHEKFDFLLSLDGHNEEYLLFCKDFEIPLIYSDEREGVGLSKNRVLEQFPKYDYYFFIEDDIELLNEQIFIIYTNFAKTHNVSHLNHFGISIEKHKIVKQEKIGNITILNANKGGGYFNFFTKEGLNKVGGWHTTFAKYKRFGHTEHTIRFYNAKLSNYYFTGIKETSKMLLIHFPPHVTNTSKLEFTKNDLNIDEEKLISEKLKFYPIKTLSNYNFLDFDMSINNKVHFFLATNKKKYPLIKGAKRLILFSEYYFFKYKTSNNNLARIIFFVLSFITNPNNNLIKNYIKQKLRLT